ncbi:NmrA family NAD(P)-binding protein [Chryseobacterium wangxinyae]|uniref:NmrA family NAD(P)-binding protein n=1 Tax=Chryseobacterium sp. CY353 TaxID=2997334 RepID=UPI00226DD9B9|nr:NmrA family NAD(P)-binding protein [Chryseobacterium sp. CY353]MCY0970761.1 NAD-dependent dehydratase [Chryseobacterium sp. CY353]
MKIIITGSLGSISKPLATKLIADAHHVTIISSNRDRQDEIEELGAKAAIGSIDDVNFLTETFSGADVAYLMEPTVNMFDPTIDMLKHYEKICENYAQAVLHSDLKKIVHLSSIGGHSSTGNGMLAFHYYAEQTLNKLPSEVAITTLRPVSFYSNIMAFIPTIKAQKAIITSYHANDPEPWASPLDIADAAAEELVSVSTGRNIRYIVSDEVSSEKLIKVLGDAVGENIQWMTVSHETLEESYKIFGMSPQAANGFARLNEAKNSGILYDDLKKHRSEITFGKIKIEDFAKDFAKAYQNS